MNTNEKPKIGYRCDNYNGVPCEERMNPYDCLSNEIWDMQNTDIIDTVNELYCGGSDKYLTEFSELVADGEFDDGLTTEDGKEWTNEEVYAYILKKVEEHTHIHIKYTLWLGSKDCVRERYMGEGDDMRKFDITNAVMLSDLGFKYDGCLFGFADEPKELEFANLGEAVMCQTYGRKNQLSGWYFEQITDVSDDDNLGCGNPDNPNHTIYPKCIVRFEDFKVDENGKPCPEKFVQDYDC